MHVRECNDASDVAFLKRDPDELPGLPLWRYPSLRALKRHPRNAPVLACLLLQRPSRIEARPVRRAPSLHRFRDAGKDFNEHRGAPQGLAAYQIRDDTRKLQYN